MPMLSLPAAGYYDRNADGSLKLSSTIDPVTGIGEPTFHAEWSRHKFAWPVGPDNSQITKAGWLNLAIGFGTAKVHVWFIGVNVDGSVRYISEETVDLAMDVRWYTQIPADSDQVSIEWIGSTDCALGVSFELQAK